MVFKPGDLVDIYSDNDRQSSKIEGQIVLIVDWPSGNEEKYGCAAGLEPGSMRVNRWCRVEDLKVRKPSQTGVSGGLGAVRATTVQMDLDLGIETRVVKVASKRGGLLPELGWTDVYVGRPSVLGNPIGLHTEADRARACQIYREFFDNQMMLPHTPVYKEVVRLYQLLAQGQKIRLVCWCTPKQCHADTICEWLERAIANPEFRVEGKT